LLLASNSKVNVSFKATPYFERYTETRKKAIEKAKFLARMLSSNRTGLISDFNRNTLAWSMNAETILFNVKWETNESDTLKNIRIRTEDGTEIVVTNNGAGFAANSLNPDIAN